MILADVKSYLVDHGRVTLTDLATHFDVDHEALRGMLDTWAKKGRLRRLGSEDGRCGTCCGCEVAGPEIYEWIRD